MPTQHKDFFLISDVLLALLQPPSNMCIFIEEIWSNVKLYACILQSNFHSNETLKLYADRPKVCLIPKYYLGITLRLGETKYDIVMNQ